MHNFKFLNPVNIVFGKNQIQELPKLIPDGAKILMVYGVKSIKSNGIYEKLIQVLASFKIVEFGGVESNPEYEKLKQAVQICKSENIDFILAVGGGSVIDGAKFISVAVNYPSNNLWQILEGGANLIINPIKLGVVLTLPATGSEMNGAAVISRRSTKQKVTFISHHVYPVFSILDPEFTYSLPPRQLANGIVDPFIHVVEQYLTTDIGTLIQDGLAEVILRTLINLAPRIMLGDKDYNVRANWMWSATNALNGYLKCGVDSDWATHMIGHALTNLYGLDHAQTIALIAPQIWRFKKEDKYKKLIKFARNVWNIQNPDPELAIEEAIVRTEEFFKNLGMKNKCIEYGIDLDVGLVSQIVVKDSGGVLGEHQDIKLPEIMKILEIIR